MNKEKKKYSWETIFDGLKEMYLEAILGGIDAMKGNSCMTLFDCVSPDDIFGDVLEIFYAGERDRISHV